MSFLSGDGLPARLFFRKRASLRRTSAPRCASRTAYVASHDLKEPLRGIHRYAHQLLEKSGQDNSDQKERIENLMRLTMRMDGLLDSLLHFSRVGRMDLEFELTDLNGVLEDAIEMVGARRPAGQCNISVPRALPKEIGRAHV